MKPPARERSADDGHFGRRDVVRCRLPAWGSASPDRRSKSPRGASTATPDRVCQPDQITDPLALRPLSVECELRGGASPHLRRSAAIASATAAPLLVQWVSVR